MSLAGLKTAVLKISKSIKNNQDKYDLAASFQKTIEEILVKKTRIAFDEFKKTSNRITFLDGRFSDIGMKIPNDIMPLISMSWLDHFQWNGLGELSKKQSVVLDEIITAVHLEKKHIRFWATPDNKNAWTVFERAGVDLINTDKVSEFSNYKILN